MGDILDFKLTFTTEYDKTEKVYRAWCEEFPDIRVESATNKRDLLQKIEHIVYNELGAPSHYIYVISFNKK